MSPAALKAMTAMTTGAAAGAGVVVSCCLLFLLRFQPSFVSLFIIVIPLVMAVAVWLAVRHAINVALKPALATARTHRAIARLTGAGLNRLAQGDTGVRIAIDLPVPYEALGRDFNAVVQALKTAHEEGEEMRKLLIDHGNGLEAASARLGKRARKLHARVEADLRLIEKLAAHDPMAALEIACHTLQGAGIAAGRNADAADDFTRMTASLQQKGQETSQSVPKKTPDRPDIAA